MYMGTHEAGRRVSRGYDLTLIYVCPFAIVCLQYFMIKGARGRWLISV